MKFYVAAPLGLAEQASAAMATIRECGHEITCDWTKTDGFLAGDAAKTANPSETERRAIADIDGVMDADAVVILTSPDFTGKGMYVELGCAIGAQLTVGSPRVFLVTPAHGLTIFYNHPAVEHVANVSDAIMAMECN